MPVDIFVQNLKFDEQGLIPVVVQNCSTNEVLTLAYMNVESLSRTLQTGQTWFWSRSRKELWHKGETSGNFQNVVDIRIDCDGDALVVLVAPEGPACHLGENTCFHRQLNQQETQNQLLHKSVSLVNQSSLELGILLDELYRLIEERKLKRPEGSYTTYLFNAGLDKILKKVGEESAETIIAAKNHSTQQMASEISDLLYHLLVLMSERGVRLEDIFNELKQRAGKAAERKYS
ncbi:MAG: bifunctional phosphoribosyl-AMP cyclohydrolase/phosphoribosyl-ATP diphosphatase HisIE [Acidobacteria bacterium]|nr:bifunctional phosphoribosyl-AMP cyclohydrolase/phosphoribosyl-ATP diphosphatase HisIE [Acidobacteriota bacterium]